MTHQLYLVQLCPNFASTMPNYVSADYQIAHQIAFDNLKCYSTYAIVFEFVEEYALNNSVKGLAQINRNSKQTQCDILNNLKYVM